MDKYTIIYDLSILPEGMTFKEILQIKDKYEIVFYDSRLKSKSAIFWVPKIVPDNADCGDLQIVDIATTEGMNKYNELLNI